GEEPASQERGNEAVDAEPEEGQPAGFEKVSSSPVHVLKPFEDRSVSALHDGMFRRGAARGLGAAPAAGITGSATEEGSRRARWAPARGFGPRPSASDRAAGDSPRRRS